MKPLWNEIIQGNRRRVRFGLGTSDVPKRVLDEWQNHYRLSPQQIGRATPLASRFTEAARELLGEYGQLGSEKRRLSSRESSQLNRAYDDLQLRFEDELLVELTPEQIRNLHTQAPVYIRLDDSRSVSISHSDNAGF